MSDSGVGIKCAKSIGDILRNNFNFAYLDLSKNSIKDSGTIELLYNIRKSFNIVHLDISSNDITPEGSKMILEMLEKNQSIISFNISSHEGLHRNRLCTEGGESLSKLLSVNRILAFLNISGTSLGPEGLSFLLNGLENNESLISLNLSNNCLGSRIIEKLSQVLFSTNIKELLIASNKIGNEGCKYLGLMLSEYQMLIKLDISDNEISTKGLSLLLDAIRINNQLTTLIIKKNNFSKGLSSNFLQVLTDNNCIQIIDFSYCSIRCEGLNEIGEGLSKNKSLISLNFCGNKIKDRGIEIIVYGLAKNKILKSIDLSSNEIKNPGAIAIAKLIRVNNILDAILLRDNSIKDKGGQALCDSIRHNQNILKITLELNPLDFKFITDIKISLRNNELYQIKMQVPKLQEIIEKKINDCNGIEKLYSHINQKKKEQEDGENKLRSHEERLQSIKTQEKIKYEEIKKESIDIKNRRTVVTAEMEAELLSLNVRYYIES